LCFTRLLKLNSSVVLSLARGAINVSRIALALRFSQRSLYRASWFQQREVTFSFCRGPVLAERIWPASVDDTFSGGIAHAFSQSRVCSQRADSSREVIHIA